MFEAEILRLIYQKFFLGESDNAKMPKRLLALGIEGSANKIGVGVVDLNGEILSNKRHTYITPAGTGFLPRETAEHHSQHVLPLVKAALEDAHVMPSDISCICYSTLR